MRSLPNSWNKTLAQLGFKRKRRDRKKQKERFNRRSLFENLEVRQMLAADLTVDTNLDNVDGTTTSVSALLSSPGADGLISLREAIEATNNTSGANEIGFAADLAQFTLGSGQLSINDDLTITGLGVDETIIDSNGASRVFHISAGFNVSLTGMTITGGNAAGGGIAGDGGGIYHTGELLTLDRVTLESNHADFNGGGLYSETGSSVSITNSTFALNTSKFGGGALLRVDGSNEISISGSTFCHNTADDGNGAGSGGGLYIWGGSNAPVAEITNSTFSGNHAVQFTGGLRAQNGGSILVVNCTITDNTSDLMGGGISAWGSPTPSVIEIHNSIIADNHDNHAGTLDDAEGNIHASSSHNLVGVTYVSALLDEATNNNVVIGTDDPLLSELKDFGGDTSTHALIEGSRAIDNADDTLLSAYGTTISQTGISQLIDIQNQGNLITTLGDIGAASFSDFVLVVDQVLDEDVETTYVPGDLSLREAIRVAQSREGANRIVFDPLVFGSGQTITLDHSLGELVIDDPNLLEIVGLGADFITVDADRDTATTGVGGNSHRVFHIETGSDVTVSGLTITGGEPESSVGGGVFNEGILVLDHVVIVDNTAVAGGGVFGDGVASRTTIRSSVIESNSAISGGGVSQFEGVLEIYDSSIRLNYATTAGGIDAFGTSLHVERSTISENTSTWVGGIRTSAELAEVLNSTVSSNSASSFIGGISLSGSPTSSSSLVNVTIIENSASTSTYAVGIDTSLTSGAVSLHNSIVADNSFGGGDIDVAGTFTTNSSYNLIKEDPLWSFSAPGNQFGLDPLLTPLGDYGGPTDTHALLPDSPAIDAGDDLKAQNGSGAPLVGDQRGTNYNRINGSAVDIGAFEAHVIVSGNDVTIYGTQGADGITLRSDGVMIDSAGGQLIPVDLQNASSVTVLGLAGDDVIAVEPSLTRGVTLDGGSGEDLLTGGAGNDYLYGNDDNDSLFGGEGVDQLFGDLGADLLSGDEGNDLLFGGGGNDFLFGQEGMDSLDGGSGLDVIEGGDGNDTLVGGSGNDLLIGNDGSDSYLGGPGSDSYEQDINDPLHAPEIEGISASPQTRKDQDWAARILADDVETAYENLSFVVSVTGGSLSGTLNLGAPGGLIRWNSSAYDPGTYNFDVTVTDSDGMQDTSSFSLNVSDYNEAPPSTLPLPAFDVFSNGTLQQLFFDYQKNPEVVPDTEIYTWILAPADSQTQSGSFTISKDSGDFPPGMMLSGSNLTWEVGENTPPGQWRAEIKVTDNGDVNGSSRSRIFPLITKVTHTTLDHNETGGQLMTFINGVAAFDDHYHIDINETLNSDLSWNDYSNDPPWGGIHDYTGVLTKSPAHASSYHFDSQTTSLSYTPETNGEGLDVVSYRADTIDELFEVEWTPGVVDRAYDIGTLGNEAPVLIEVGKAVRADIDIDLPEFNPDATQKRSLWHTYDPGADAGDDLTATYQINDDDDNDNSLTDLKELSGPVEGEDDLLPVRLGYWLREDAFIDDFTATLQVSTLADSIIRIWDSQTKDNEIVPRSSGKVGTEFLLSELPEKVWVEGLASGFATLSLLIDGPSTALFTGQVVPPGGATADTSDSDTVQLSSAGLTAYRPMYTPGGYAPFKRTSVKDDHEFDSKLGPGIRINNDDDNANGQNDLNENGTVANENDLIEITVNRVAEQNNLVLTANQSKIKLWTSPTKGTQIQFPNGLESEPLSFGGQNRLTLYVEWHSTSHGTEIVELKNKDTGVSIDQLRFHTFKSIVVGLSGFTGDAPEDPRDDLELIKLSGMYDLATKVYERGYDVYYYNENEVKSGPDDLTSPTGTGAAFNEVLAAHQGNGTNFQRFVTQVGLFGHSRGGGSVRDLAWRINGSVPGLTIEYTAYVDAIKNGGATAERRFPTGSKFHDNYYQKLLDGFPDGDKTTLEVPPSAWVNNVDVNKDRNWKDPKGGKVNHKEIDDLEELHEEVKTHMEGVLER